MIFFIFFYVNKKEATHNQCLRVSLCVHYQRAESQVPSVTDQCKIHKKHNIVAVTGMAFAIVNFSAISRPCL